MILWAILIVLAALAGVWVRAIRRRLRERSERTSLKHIIGVKAWWGQR
jgi:hypothetical protein